MYLTSNAGKHEANVMKHAVPAKRGETRNVHDLFTIGVTSSIETEQSQIKV